MKLSAGGPFNCLVLEDDITFGEDLAAAVESLGGIPTLCRTIADAETALASNQFDVILLDNYVPDGKGENLFPTLSAKGVYAPCIMLTGSADIPTAVKLTRIGLFDYLTKPIAMDQVQDCLQRALQNVRNAESTLSASGLVASCPGMKRAYRLACQAADNPKSTILLTGESGSGKDAIANAIHRLTFRNHPSPPNLVHLNCSALPADMFESELFGTRKGAFTGAAQDRTGLAEAAGEGTLFLDEIAEIPLPMQAKLLQFLETGTFRRLGATNVQQFRGRIIAATNKSLEQEVRAGRFRNDLLFRLDVLNIQVPPLRERKEDIPELVSVFLDSVCKKSNRAKPLVSGKDLALLNQYHYPGNLRELRNILERSLIQTPLDSKWLHLDLPSACAPVIAHAKQDPSPLDLFPNRNLLPLEKPEYMLIWNAIKAEQGHIRRAAARLQITHQALLRRLDKWPELRTAHQSDAIEPTTPQ